MRTKREHLYYISYFMLKPLFEFFLSVKLDLSNGRGIKSPESNEDDTRSLILRIMTAIFLVLILTKKIGFLVYKVPHR